jgi:tetratricopeptide (TPR) repeat protein
LTRRAYAGAADKDLKRRLGAGAVRCALSLNDGTAATEFVGLLNRDFPRDPEILYLSVHTYSDLSLRASQTLLFAHPDAYQVHQLNAEALETQAKWDQAAEEYRTVLRMNPNLPGIHYRLGRIILSRPETPATREEAAKEFREELRIDPTNAGAEFVLAEFARVAEKYPEAIERFGRAAKLDAMFADAYIGLGRSLMAVEKGAEAIAPLEHAAKLQPANPTVHFLLANAYRRAGRLADADRESQIHRETSEKARATRDEVKKGVSGTIGKSQ